ncbi:iron chelate uptake ABC transporter family permease subunit, partial [Stomatohabitans albus]
ARTIPVYHRRPFWVLTISLVVLIVASIAFVTLSVDNGKLLFTWDAVSPSLTAKLLGMRLGKLGPMIVVGFAVGLATIVFQTITRNRILTPSIMGIDDLFALIQTLLVFFLGGMNVSAIPGPLLFGLESILLLGMSSLLFYVVFIRAHRSLYSLALVGIITGIFFRSIASLFKRLIDPQEFLVVIDRSLARFEAVDPALFLTTLALCGVASLIIWHCRYQLDILTLGRASSISLGLAYSPVVLVLLVCCALLVSVTTALIGPLTFLGLLVANIAVAVSNTYSHSWLLPITGVIGSATLVSAQFVLERLLGVGTVVMVVIELIGGMLFLILLLKGAIK